MGKGLSAKARRDKGHSFEREIAQKLRPVYPGAKRGLQSRDGADAPDVDCTPWHVECKAHIRPNIAAAMRQGDKATDGRPVVAVTKADYQRVLVTMYLDDWLELVAATSGDDEDYDATWTTGEEEP